MVEHTLHMHTSVTTCTSWSHFIHLMNLSICFSEITCTCLSCVSWRRGRVRGRLTEKSHPVFSRSFLLSCLIKTITDMAIYTQRLYSHTHTNISHKNWTSQTDTNTKCVPHEGCLRAWGHADWLTPGGSCPFPLTSPCQWKCVNRYFAPSSVSVCVSM